MSIDWFTFAAQIVNFLILVVLLRRFLYGPIVRTMQQREERIAARLQQAEKSQREGEEQARQYEQQRRDFDVQRETRLKEVQREADDQRQRLTTEAREEVQRKRLEWFQAFELEREELLSELQQEAGRLTTEATRRTLEQLADESLEERMLVAFSSRLQNLDAQRQAEIEGVLGNGTSPVCVRSAFAVPAPWRDRLQGMLRQQFGHAGTIDFEQSPELICGIELEAGGYGFGWSIRQFLRDLEAEFDERLQERDGAAPT